MKKSRDFLFLWTKLIISDKQHFWRWNFRRGSRAKHWHNCYPKCAIALTQFVFPFSEFTFSLSLSSHCRCACIIAYDKTTVTLPHSNCCMQYNKLTSIHKIDSLFWRQSKTASVKIVPTANYRYCNHEIFDKIALTLAKCMM